MAARTASLGEAFNVNRAVRLYGRPISNLPAPTDIATPTFRDPRGAPTFALIRAFSVGSFCRQLPTQVVFLVPGPGEEVADDDECGHGKSENVWIVYSSEETLLVSMDSGNVLDLLRQVETRDISGGLQIENARFENGQLCATVHAWAEITIFGQKASFDERIPVCIPLQGCHSVWSIEIARIDVCFKAPSDLCVRLCVGKWGLEKCWDACSRISLGARESLSNSHCDCKGGELANDARA
jgi:hypothetical protein